MYFGGCLRVLLLWTDTMTKATLIRTTFNWGWLPDSKVQSIIIKAKDFFLACWAFNSKLQWDWPSGQPWLRAHACYHGHFVQKPIGKDNGDRIEIGHTHRMEYLFWDFLYWCLFTWVMKILTVLIPKWTAICIGLFPQMSLQHFSLVISKSLTVCRHEPASCLCFWLFL